MKNEEDEAFDELARKQGSWGGGFKAKRQAAMDKLQEPNTITFSTSSADWVMRITADRRIEVNEGVEVTEAAQKVLEAMQWILKPAQETPKYAMSAYWEDDGRIGVVATIERPDGGFHLLGAIIDPPPAKEKNND